MATTASTNGIEIGTAEQRRRETERGTSVPNRGPGSGANGSESTNGDAPPTGSEPWTPDASSRLYGIQNWGQGYFSVNPEGNVVLHPNQDPSRAIDLKKLVDELRERDIQLPCLIRFTDILKHRVGQL